MKKCSDCRHCKDTSTITANCVHPHLPQAWRGTPPGWVRLTGACGMEGHYFQPKPTLLRRFMELAGLADPPKIEARPRPWPRRG